MTLVSFVPGVGLIADAYFLGKALYAGFATGEWDWRTIGLSAVGVAGMAVGAVRAVRMLGYADELADAGRMADRVTDLWSAKRIHRSLPHGTAGHWAKIESEVGNMAKDGKYSDILVNKALSTATGGLVHSGIRADIVGETFAGTFDIVEVVSPSQTVRNLYQKVDYIENILDDSFGSGRVTLP